MADYGMTPQGFVPKRLARIVEDLNTNIAGIVDHASGEFPFRNASDDSILQQILGVFAEGLSECWEAAYDGSVQFDPLKNTGAGQAGTVQLNAMLVKPGASTIVRMRLGGKNGVTVPKGSRIATADNQYVFATREAASIGVSGTVEVLAQCTVKGAADPAKGTVISIQNPTPGWLTATNLETVSLGSPEETGEQVRRRQQRSTSLTSYRQIEAVYAAVMNVPGVVYCRAYQNSRTHPADARGIPFKEVAVVAEGGDPRAIAEALFYRFPVGVAGYGTTTEVFYDAQGISHAISFSRPEEISVAVRIDVAITNRAEFPDTGAERIKQAVMDYAAYGGDGNDDGFPPGDNVVCSRLYTPVNNVPGHKITRLEIAAVPDAGDPAFSTDDLIVAWNQVARFDPERILVNVTT